MTLTCITLKDAVELNSPWWSYVLTAFMLLQRLFVSPSADLLQAAPRGVVVCSKSRRHSLELCLTSPRPPPNPSSTAVLHLRLHCAVHAVGGVEGLNGPGPR